MTNTNTAAASVEMIDAAMVEMQNIHPPLKRSECQRLINAALAAPAQPVAWQVNHIADHMADEWPMRKYDLAEIEQRLRGIPAAPQPAAPDITGAYAGAQEDIAIWKKRALEAEALNHRFIADINGPTFVGEPTTSDDAFIAREFYESQDDSLLLCASDLQHSAIYDNHIEMQSCIRAVADRITALASVIEGVERAALDAQAQAVPAPEVPSYSASAVREACGKIIKTLAAIVNSPQSDDQLDNEVLQRDPVMAKVMEIKSQVDAIYKAVPLPIHPAAQAQEDAKDAAIEARQGGAAWNS